MRLIGFLRDGTPWMGRVEAGLVHPLRPIDAFYRDTAAALLAAPDGPPLSRATLVEVPPVPTGAKVICAGLNYRSHAAEAKREPPTVPDLFARWPSTLTVNGAAVPLPRNEPGLDWEGELAAVLAHDIRHGEDADVEAAILGYACFNDLSARLHQRASRQWAVGKNADASGPIGPELVTPDEVGDPYALRLTTRVDGAVMQDGSTAQMLFRIGRIGAHAAECMTLRAGDVICTGTPEGIGAARTPPVFLQAGQVVEVEIERVGTLRTPIAAARPPATGRLP